MGYVPPDPGEPSAAELIRRDLSPLLTHLFVTFGVGAMALAARHFPPPSSYQRYVNDLYGNRPTDNFMFLNNALLACLITLTVLITYLVTT